MHTVDTRKIGDTLLADIARVKSIPIVESMLEVVCRSTGMRFAAIARVTDDRWIACEVRDEIAFGLVSGGELQLETTICNEIRDNRQPVVIDNVAESDLYRYHHTPRIYGIQSYISYPIVLKNGDFFGTLCAIDPAPAKVSNPQIMGMFSLFSELIAFHLQSLDTLERNQAAVDELNKQLKSSTDENRQYQYISNHNLQEPLRKLRVFSEMLEIAVDARDNDKIKDLSAKINHSAKRFSMLIQDLSNYSELTYTEGSFERVDLTSVLTTASGQLKSKLDAHRAILDADALPVINGLWLQLERLFYHLLRNSLTLARTDIPTVIRISYSPVAAHDSLTLPATGTYFEIRFEDNGTGLEKAELERIFDIFSHLSHGVSNTEQRGIGLAYCRKIVDNHGGAMRVQSEPGHGTVVSIILPVNIIVTTPG